MNEDDSIPLIGQVVRIMQGREAGQYALVIKIIDEKYVLLADGEKRKYDRPKKKNLHHIERMDYISPEVQNSLLETGRVTNGKLRFAIAKFVNEVVTDLKKGDQHDGERRCN
ncbi:MAG: KOW motif-containing protein [Bacillota bacterium]|uniref:KOW domain-containing RNA-binding protein n=1 Tax=Virgibacillus salarius TaxID=447199 RepID=A0A941IAI4_9BACI|nr:MULTISPECIES: KOW domain-containing RNA-binding protein [Bacillaceae]NAZ08104.1 RNA-binding protein [Agaribacter marinus]MBR7795391.1 KOW domain-containing RNA-binding protein [Virgibacillus salarius]MDY7044328.1 KOW domain-containing RNA-binding protein [Virgibacillus sp. M23]QRZ19172.1 KOW domain-containing RNA-binding protein [Virgibacillus sp. AGTR]WBX81155.1 KOW domain-containing RNA-binding protein [Virgibacillus salarius]